MSDYSMWEPLPSRAVARNCLTLDPPRTSSDGVGSGVSQGQRLVSSTSNARPQQHSPRLPNRPLTAFRQFDSAAISRRQVWLFSAGSQKPKRLSNFIHGIERMPARSTPVG